ELMGKVELADYRFTKDSKGSSIKDVDAFFKGKKGIKRKVIETHDDVKQVDYWYVDPLMTEKSFTNSKGIQGWKDYKELMGKVELADYRFTKDSKGSSIKDVDAFFKGK
ncbi:hypothetical protein ACSE35_01660, partial [Staphylococcus aureus]